MLKRTWTMFRESVAMSISNIFHNKMRSFLTTLGILIGVTAIIALITTVQGVTTEVTSQFESLGAGKVIVNATGTALKPGLNAGDIQALSEVENVRGVSPSVSATANVKSAGEWAEDVSIEGKNQLYFQQDETLISRGRPINILDVENENKVAVIDSVLAEKVFFAQDPLGQKVFIGGIEYTIIGLLSDEAGNDVMSQAMGGSSDGQAIIPYTNTLKMNQTHYINSLEVYIADTTITTETVNDLEQVLTEAFNYKDDSYSVINMESLLDTMNAMLGMMTGLLAGIASIALLVGGIGIMNMMLVSVTERTTEIGLRKALGAQPGQIQLQFLIESFVLSLIGGLLGMVLGVVISYVLCGLLGTPFVLSPSAIGLGVGFSAAVGIIFGWTPARRASNLNPIDALRSV